MLVGTPLLTHLPRAPPAVALPLAPRSREESVVGRRLWVVTFIGFGDSFPVTPLCAVECGFFGLEGLLPAHAFPNFVECGSCSEVVPVVGRYAYSVPYRGSLRCLLVGCERGGRLGRS